MKLNVFKRKGKKETKEERLKKHVKEITKLKQASDSLIKKEKENIKKEKKAKPLPAFDLEKDKAKEEIEKYKAKHEEKPVKKFGFLKKGFPKKKKQQKSLFQGTLRKDINKHWGRKIKKPFSKRKKKKFTIRGFVKIIDLQDYLEKAGSEGDARQLAKKVFRINIFLCLALTLIIILLNLVFKKGFVNLITFLIGFWLTIFFILLAIIWIVYLFYIDMKIFRRTREVEAVFPDFLQLTSSNISAGMPIDKALWYAVRPSFGVLAKEIETVAKNTMAGEDLSTALTTFARKYNSKTIQRSVSLLLEGMSSGGEMAVLLNKISLNIEETKILRKEMAASVTTYVIFITFATILAAPVLFGLATQLLTVIQDITSKLGGSMSSSGSFFSFSFSGESIKIIDFKIFSYLMLIISAFSSACIVSVIKKGNVKSGITSIPFFIITSIILYTIASLIISGMFGSFV